MLWYDKLLARADAAKMTGNRLEILENIVWHVHCFVGIYRCVFGRRSLRGRLAFIGGGILLYFCLLPRVFDGVAAAAKIGGFVGWYFKWFCILLFPVGWSVALPMIMYLMEASPRKR